MALGQQQGRPVTTFQFQVNALTGKVATAAAFVDTLDTATDDTYLGVASTSDGAGTGATFDVVVSGNAVDTVTLAAPGSGYAVGDTLVIGFASITGASSGTVASTVATVVGEVATLNAFSGGTGWVVGDVVSASELSTDSTAGAGLSVTVSAASALNYDSPETGGVPSAATVLTGGVDYEGSDTLNYIGAGEVGVSDKFTYYDHTQYELGGNIEEYKEGNGLTVTVSETSGPITGLAVNTGGANYRVGDTFAVSPTLTTGTGAGGIGVVATVDANGAVLTMTVGTAGDNYDDTEVANTVFLTRTLNTMATGEYAGSNSDNDPTVTVGRLADQEQLIVQQRDIDGGTITVFAEPTTVNSVGQVVGNTIRAEDITDEYRCVAVKVSDGINPRFKWVTSTTGDANGASYGYCTERTVAELNADATTKVDADCPAGYVASTTNCVVVAIATVNSKEAIFDADRTTDGSTGTNNKTAMEQCLANGGYYEPNAASGSRCIDASTPGNFSLANFAYGTVSSAQDYAATVCRQHGYDWITPTMVCQAKTDPTTLVTQATCAAAGHVWVAGTCYDKADFGDGYSRQGNEGDVNTQPK